MCVLANLATELKLLNYNDTKIIEKSSIAAEHTYANFNLKILAYSHRYISICGVWYVKIWSFLFFITIKTNYVFFFLKESYHCYY